MRLLASVLVALALAAAASSCVAVETPPGTFFATTPPGARVLLDGRDSGFVTPCHIDLRDEAPVTVRLELLGYQPAEVRLVGVSDRYVVPWKDGYTSPHGLRFPLFLPGIDLLAPLKVDKGPVPARVHMRLEATAEEG